MSLKANMAKVFGRPEHDPSRPRARHRQPDPLARHQIRHGRI